METKRGTDWLTEDMKSRLGEVYDRVIAEEAGVSVVTVSLRRRKLGILPRRKRRMFRADFPVEAENLFGKMTDIQIAKAFDLDSSSVSRRRMAKGVASYQAQRHRFLSEKAADLHAKKGTDFTLQQAADYLRCDPAYLRGISGNMGLSWKRKPHQKNMSKSLARDAAVSVLLKSGFTLESVAKVVGLTRERVRQIEEKMPRNQKALDFLEECKEGGYGTNGDGETEDN